MARPGDLQLSDLAKVQLIAIDAPGYSIHADDQLIAIDAPGYSIHADDQLHLAGHTAPPTPPRLRMFLRGRSTSRSPTRA